MQALANHQAAFGIQMGWRETFHSDGDIEVARKVPVNKMKLVRFFPNVDPAANDVPTRFNGLCGTGQVRRANIDISKISGRPHVIGKIVAGIIGA